MDPSNLYPARTCEPCQVEQRGDGPCWLCAGPTGLARNPIRSTGSTYMQWAGWTAGQGVYPEFDVTRRPVTLAGAARQPRAA